ncbi:tetratricopeptide repeat protein [Sphingomonas sp. So64.6b]|uniref:tetratricopeptide repeat protein n=1 Tax=Sphingomonas sp. So64.6b TaxID=2997354 RepID=UPI0016014F54|nr:tetratricopeptide repeat protein [Sphingomonas sp. So64.6b]QNA85616.1 tetratricopeptide repeat protein [Sphingomonas sp. So64.6b]
MRNYLTAAVLLIGVGAIPGTAVAQSAVENRVERLEGQMRAVQRKVFPPQGQGGNNQLIQPDIAPGEYPAQPSGTPSGSPVADLTARVDALESQLSGLTGQIEQLQFKNRQVEEGFAAFKRSTEARLTAIEGTTSGSAVAGDTATQPVATATPKPVTPKPATPAVSTPAPAKDAARATRAAAIEKPATDDAGEDTYNYGYRLWEAKLYPEAEVQFKSLIKDYPQHRRISRAQNMLGRSLLDGGKPNLAILAFYDNYRKMPKGDRAHESLFYLAQALVKLNKPAAEVCKVYDELEDVYPDKLSPQMKADVARGRVTSKCK